MAEIHPETLAQRLRDGDSVFLLDIRPDEDFDEWHIPDSRNIDVYDELQSDPEAAKDRLREVRTDQEVVTVCAAGEISQLATESLEELGYEAKTLVDGMRGWSRVHQHATIEVDIPGTLVQVARPGKGCLSHVLISRGEAAVFDPSHYAEVYESIIAEYGATFVGVYDTHAHADHLSGGAELARRNEVPYHLHPADALEIEATPVRGGDVHAVGDVELEIVHTPGHSPGGVTYVVGGNALLTGDTLFHESVGRVELGVEAGLEETDVEDNAATLYESLQPLRELDGDPWVLPAHDPGSPTPPVRARLSEVEKRNADLTKDRDAFVAALASDIPEHPPNFQRVKRVNVGAAEVPAHERSSLELGPNRCAAE